MKDSICIVIVHLSIGMRVKSIAPKKLKLWVKNQGSFLKICAVLKYHEEGHNSTMVEVEGEIVEQNVFVLVDPGLTHNYITPGLVEMCTLKKSKHKRSWLV